MSLSMLPYLLVIIAAILWGSAGVLIKIIALSPFVLAFFRTAVPLLITGAMLVAKKQNPFHHHLPMMLLGSFFFAAHLVLVYASFGKIASIGLVTSLLYIWPFFALLFGVLIKEEKMTVLKLGLTTLAFAGVLMISVNRELTLSSGEMLGYLLAISAAISYALYITITKQHARHYRPTETVFYQNLLGAFVFLPFLLLHQPFPTLTQVGLATFYAALLGVIAFLLFVRALKSIHISTASILAYTEVVSSFVFGALFLHNQPSLMTLLGCALIIGASLVLSIHKEEKI